MNDMVMMNILNKLNKWDKEEIKRAFKQRYLIFHKIAKEQREEFEKLSKENDEHCKAIWLSYNDTLTSIITMEDDMDIIGIDYSDWAGGFKC